MRALKNTQEPCKNLQVTLIDIKYLKLKNENDSKTEPTKTENLNLDNVIVKSDPNEDGTGIEYVLQGKHRQTTEEIDEKLRIENNVVKTEPANRTDNDDNNKIQEENIIKEVEANIVNDELKYEIVIEEPDDKFYDEVDLKSVLDDLKDKVKNEKVNSAATSTTNENKNKVQKRNKIDEKRRKEVLKCSVCDKSFMTSDHLTLHMNKHTGVKPHACDLCSKTFCNRSYLEIHKGLHENVRLFKCSVCNKKFSQNAIRTVHMRTHTREKPYECDICNKTFSVKHSLVYHQRIHSGEKPYTCEVCNKAFSIRGNLLNHQRIHTGEKPYNCKVCNKAFSFSGNLLKHQRTQHDIQTKKISA